MGAGDGGIATSPAPPMDLQFLSRPTFFPDRIRYDETEIFPLRYSSTPRSGRDIMSGANAPLLVSRVMIIRISDIPTEGRDVSFDLDEEELNERVQAVRKHIAPHTVAPPPYIFEAKPHASLHLDLEGSSVLIDGQASGTFSTPCARCAEDARYTLDLPINIVLKPQTSTRPGDADEDVAFGFYNGEEVDCSEIVEEQLIIALPMTALCAEDCKGLCPQCGKNLNQERCECAQPRFKDDRFAVLEKLKIQ